MIILIESPQFQVISNYTAQLPDELSLDIGDVVSIRRKMPDGKIETHYSLYLPNFLILLIIRVQYNECIFDLHVALLINRRMPECNIVLQTGKDLFEPEIRPNLPENAKFLLFLNPKYPKNVWAFPS